MATVTRSEHPHHPSTCLWDTQVSHPAWMSLTMCLGNTGDPRKPWPGPWHTAAAHGNTNPPSVAREPRGDSRGCLQGGLLAWTGWEGRGAQGLKTFDPLRHMPTAPMWTCHVLGCPRKGRCRTFPSGTCMHTRGWETESPPGTTCKEREA